MVTPLTRTVFVGTFTHTVDEKNRIAIPAKWRSAVRGTQEFFVLPDPKNCLFVLPQSAMAKMLDRADDISLGEYGRRDVLRLIASQAHGTPCDKQGRIGLPDHLLKHAGITEKAMLVGVLTRFEIWEPERFRQLTQSTAVNFTDAAKELGL